jgi:hypothetical protein
MNRMNAQEAFHTWLLYAGLVVGGVIAAAFVVAVFVVAMSSRKREE